MSIDIEFLKYPIGKFKAPESITTVQIQESIEKIKSFPSRLFTAVSPLSPAQLNTPYRPGGWTVRQLVHHCADSHMNAFVRFKLALTEENPTIKAYDEAAWAEMPDYELSVETALSLIKGIHAKWVSILEKMEDADFSRTYFHPEKQRSQPLSEVTLMYAWHSEHHLAHVQHLVLRNFDQ